jgi:hypothetical protein
MRFLEIIDKSFVGRLIQNRLNILEHIDPDRIYVENVRAFYGLPFFAAKFLCELAVREGILAKRFAVECPNEGRLILSVSNKAELPQIVKCRNCELLEETRYEFDLNSCHIVEYYTLVDKTHG